MGSSPWLRSCFNSRDVMTRPGARRAYSSSGRRSSSRLPVRPGVGSRFVVDDMGVASKNQIFYVAYLTDGPEPGCQIGRPVCWVQRHGMRRAGPRQGPMNDQRRRVVLLVDDHQASRELLRRILALSGWQVLEAAT